MANSCPGCGTSLNAGNRFCGDCGRPVTAPAIAAPTAARSKVPAASSRVLFVVPEGLAASSDGPRLLEDLRLLTSVPVLLVSRRCAFRAKWDTHSGASGTVFRAIRDTLNMGA